MSRRVPLKTRMAALAGAAGMAATAGIVGLTPSPAHAASTYTVTYLNDSNAVVGEETIATTQVGYPVCEALHVPAGATQAQVNVVGFSADLYTHSSNCSGSSASLNLGLNPAINIGDAASIYGY